MLTRTAARIALLSLVAAAATALAPAAFAGGSVNSLTTTLIGGNCGSTSTPFGQWGDVRSYYPVPGGDFESAAGPWTLAGGAATIPGNEPYHVRLGSDATSLLLPAGASATASNVCFGLLNPGIRFFAAGVGGPATLHVEIVTRSLLGLLSVLDGGTVTVAPGWAPTPVFSTAGSQLAMLAGAKTIQLRISTVSGNAQIDDVYVDPFCSR